MKAADFYLFACVGCVFVMFGPNVLADAAGSLIITHDPSAVPLAGVCPRAQLGQFRHGTKCTGYYGDNGLVDIQIAGKATAKEYVSTKSLVHAGVDLIAPNGSEVFAIADGTVDDVISSEKDPNFMSLGFMVLLEHKSKIGGNATYSTYLHLKEKPSVALGDAVFGGKTVVGRVGATGMAFGPHVHLEVRHFASRFSPQWKNIYGIERPQSEATFDATSFAADWIDPENFATPPSSGDPGQAVTPAGTPTPAAGNAPWAVIDRALAAIGPKNQLAKMRGLCTKTEGTMTSGSKRLNFASETFQQWPSRFRNQMTVTRAGDQASRDTVIVDGLQGWEQVGSRVSNLSASRLAEAREDFYAGNLLFLLASSDRAGFAATSLGESFSNGQALSGVSIASEGHGAVKLFFDKETALLRRREQSLSGTFGKKITQVVEYDEYKRFGEYNLAARFSVFRDGQKYVDMEMLDAKFFPELDNSLFARNGGGWVDISTYLAASGAQGARSTPPTGGSGVDSKEKLTPTGAPVQGAIEEDWKKDSFIEAPLGKVQISHNLAPNERNPAKRLYNQQDLNALKAWEASGLLRVRQLKDFTKEGSSGWNDWLKLTQEGVGLEIQVSLTERGNQVNTSRDPSKVRIRQGSFRVTNIASDDELQKDFDRYRLVSGFHKAQWAEEYKQVIRNLGLSDPSDDRKFRALFKFDKFGNGWKLIATDTAGANEEFPSNRVQGALDTRR